MFNENTISTFIDAVTKIEEEKTKCDEVISLIKELQIKDFSTLRSAIDTLSNSVSLTYSLEDVDFYLKHKGIGENLTVEDKMNILEDFVGNVSSYGEDFNELLPLVINDYIESLND